MCAILFEFPGPLSDLLCLSTKERRQNYEHEVSLAQTQVAEAEEQMRWYRERADELKSTRLRPTNVGSPYSCRVRSSPLR